MFDVSWQLQVGAVPKSRLRGGTPGRYIDLGVIFTQDWFC